MLMQLKHKQFFIKYKMAFFSSKFLITNMRIIFILKFIRYNIDINKYSIIPIFWAFLFLFGQLPKISSYTKQITERISYSSLIITQAIPRMLFYVYKLINFFLLKSSTDLQIIKKKMNILVLNDNSYYQELSHFPRFFLNSFNINVYVEFRDFIFLSVLEKVTVLRLLQLPINLEFAQPKRKKRFMYKKSKANKIK